MTKKNKMLWFDSSQLNCYVKMKWRLLAGITNISFKMRKYYYECFSFLFFNSILSFILFYFFSGLGRILLFFNFFLFYFFSFIFISWKLITLQYCSGFCHTLTCSLLKVMILWTNLFMNKLKFVSKEERKWL